MVRTPVGEAPTDVHTTVADARATDDDVAASDRERWAERSMLMMKRRGK
jgi:hypothetical protein